MKTQIKNVVVLDMTRATPESVSQIVSIGNAAVVLVTPKTRPLVGQLNINNLANVVEIEEEAIADMPVQVHNGNSTLTAQMLETPSILKLNGNIVIPADVEIANMKAMLFANGNLYVPQKLQAEIMGRIQHNGNLIVYPQGYELIVGDLDLDAVAIQAGSKYYVTGKLTAVKADAAMLREKGIHIHCGDAYVAQGLIAAFAELNAKRVVPIPEGYAFLQGDIRLDDMTAALYGKDLFVLGNVDVHGLEGIENLNVTGRAYVPSKLGGSFMRVCPGFRLTQLVLYDERLIRLSDCKLEPEMLADGRKTYVIDDVEIEGSITPQMLRDGVEAFFLFGDIACTSAQMPAVQELCRLQNGDILNVNSDMWRMMQVGKRWGQDNDEDTKIVGDLRIIHNAMNYKL